MKKTGIFLVLLLIGLVPIFFGIFHTGFFLTDDGNWMVIRLSAFYEALRQGQLPVRYLLRLNNGYGYPVADFLYPLFLYLGSFIHFFHIPFVMTTKLLFGVSVAGGAIGSFFWLKKQYGTLGGFVGALAYSLFPYHLWDITKRGSLGEVLAMGIVPFIFWQIEEGNVLFTGVGIGFLILSHNTLALLFLPFILGFMLFLHQIRNAVFATLIGLALSAFFWLPALYDQQYTVFNTITVAHFSSYFLSSNFYSLIGLVSFVVILLSLVLIFKKPDNKVAFFLVVTLLSLSLTTSVSHLLWQVLPLGKYVQFPFRFLSLTALGVGFLAAYVVSSLSRKWVVAGMVVVLLYISSWQFFIAKSYQYYPDTFYSTNEDSTTVQNEYMPKWVQGTPGKPLSKITTTGGIVNNIIDRQSFLAFTSTATTSSQVIIATVYFPGWKATVDSRVVSITPQRRTGFITFSVPSGSHSVQVKFKETPVRVGADMVSLVALLFVIVGVVWESKQRKKK